VKPCGAVLDAISLTNVDGIWSELDLFILAAKVTLR
jgi:hypothetical protein